VKLKRFRQQVKNAVDNAEVNRKKYVSTKSKKTRRPKALSSKKRRRRRVTAARRKEL